MSSHLLQYLVRTRKRPGWSCRPSLSQFPWLSEGSVKCVRVQADTHMFVEEGVNVRATLSAENGLPEREFTFSVCEDGRAAMPCWLRWFS